MKKPPKKSSDFSAKEMNDLLRELMFAMQPESPEPSDYQLHQLPPPFELAGRSAELDGLKELIESGVVAGVVLHGPEGVGKTAFVLQLAAQLSPVYDHAQFYFDLQGGAGQPLTPADVMAHIIRAFHPDSALAHLPESFAELSEQYGAALRGRRTLLLLDKVADAAQIQALLPPAGCVLLTTSRQAIVLPELLSRQLDPLPVEASLELLLRIAPRIGEHAEPLIGLCGGLPLALRLAAGFLAMHQKVTPADYVKRLTKRRRSQEPLVAVVGLNYELMPTVRRQLWGELSVFPTSFDAVAAAAVWDMLLPEMLMPPDLTFKALDGFVELGLLQPLGAESPARRYILHDAARAEACASVQADKRLAAERLYARHYLNVVQSATMLQKAGRGGINTALDLYDQERLNIAVGRAWAAAHSSEDKEAAKWTADYLYLGIPVLIFRLRADEVHQWLRDAVRAVRSAGKPQKVSGLLGQVGGAYQDLSNKRLAIEYLEKALAAAREIGDPMGEQRALGGLGDAYQAAGKLEKAIDVYRQYLEFVRQEGDRRGEGYLLNNLGAALGRMGRAREAQECFEQQLVIMREIGDREHEGHLLGNLGILRIDAGETLAAIDYFNQALAILSEIGDRASQANMLGNLAGAYLLAGELEKAVEAYDQSVPLLRKLGNRRGAADALWNQSQALERIGQLQRAIECAQTALKLREELKDPGAADIRRKLILWRGGRTG